MVATIVLPSTSPSTAISPRDLFVEGYLPLPGKEVIVKVGV